MLKFIISTNIHILKFKILTFVLLICCISMSQPTRKCYATRRAAAVAPDLACSDGKYGNVFYGQFWTYRQVMGV